MEVGGGIGTGNTCKSMADSFQCMTKPTTIKNVTEGKKKSSKVYLEFLVPIKSTIVTEGRKGKELVFIEV